MNGIGYRILIKNLVNYEVKEKIEDKDKENFQMVVKDNNKEKPIEKVVYIIIVLQKIIMV